MTTAVKKYLIGEDAVRRCAQRQFLITVIGMSLCFWATMAGKNIAPLASVVVVAITGAAGVSWREKATAEKVLKSDH